MTQLVDNKVMYGEKDAGCWFDGARGAYIGDCIIKTAIEHGWKCDVEPTEGPSWAPGDTWTNYEHYHELTDEAEEYMQQFAAEGFYFGYNEHTGDWGLWDNDQKAL